MLKFYSYFKQATEGPCTSAKPGFWDVVNRKKWEAWAKLGRMEAEEAMLLYVDELKKVSKHVRTVYYPPEIVETMPQTDDVSEFLQKLDNFYEMVEDSDNHNSLKVYDKESPHGDPDDHPFDCSFNGSPGIESEFEHSQGITKLLQQDICWWQNSRGLVKAHKANGDINHGERERKEVIHESLSIEHVIHTDRGRGENRTGEIPAYDPEGETNPPDTPGTPGTEEEWEEVEARASNSGSHSGQSGGSLSDSETENEEEFCDTSDEPVETIHPQEVSAVSTPTPTQIRTQPALLLNPVISASSSSLLTSATPTSMVKSVHFDEHHAVTAPMTSKRLAALQGSTPSRARGELSDSLLVNPSPQTGRLMDVTAVTAPMTSKRLAALQGSTPSRARGELSDSLLVNPSPQTGRLMDVTSSSLTEGCSEVVSVGNQTMEENSSDDVGVGRTGSKMDISVCRGGDGEEGDRDRMAQGSVGRFGRDGIPQGRGG
ncbi:hypothetical protein EGW08_005711 [Elysia chlorotica]|uniref:ACB domain-containing protein n=1 Tax=Elysia chlorotica TaxID=188477 RepID=A0A433TY63_ELYCH|nr:hypothetical protein EGW08_005711 [Elysia chlorotica]